MKYLKILALVLVIGFASCTDNEEIVQTDGTVIQEDLFGIDKKDETNINNDGGDDHDFDEE